MAMSAAAKVAIKGAIGIGAAAATYYYGGKSLSWTGVALLGGYVGSGIVLNIMETSEAPVAGTPRNTVGETPAGRR